jgi:hypothetical protein
MAGGTPRSPVFVQYRNLCCKLGTRCKLGPTRLSETALRCPLAKSRHQAALFCVYLLCLPDGVCQIVFIAAICLPCMDRWAKSEFIVILRSRNAEFAQAIAFFMKLNSGFQAVIISLCKSSFA